MTNKLSDPTLAKFNEGGDPSSKFDPLAYEQQNVHSVYQEIASHFSHTRYKPWPLIPAFLSTLPAGSIGIDLGCGNGKYLHLRSILAPDFLHPSETEVQTSTNNTSMNLLTIGADRSSNLIELALQNYPEPKTFGPGPGIAWNPSVMKERNEVAVADALGSGFRSHAFDYAISIATIHHFSTHERRRKAVEELIRLVRPMPRSAIPKKEQKNPATSETSDPSKLPLGHGRFMIYAWALEQRGESRRNWDGKKEQNQKETEASNPIAQAGSPKDSHQPSALPEASKNSQIESNSKEQPSTATTRSEDQKNFQDKSQQDVLVPWVIPTHLVNGGKKKQDQNPQSVKKKSKGKAKGKSADGEEATSSSNAVETDRKGTEHGEQEASAESKEQEDHPVYQRYYHVFRSGELEELVREASVEMFGENQTEYTVERQAGGWEKGNWWGIWQVIQE